MRQLDQKELGAIAGGYSPARRLWSSNRCQLVRPPDPLTVTFGTPVEPGFELPGILRSRHFR